jgi:hypothetical protein
MAGRHCPFMIKVMFNDDGMTENVFEIVPEEPYDRFKKITHIPIPWNFLSLEL